MTDLAASEKAKERGNAEFAAKNFQAAIDAYTEAIDLGGGSNVLYSNRSGAYASAGDWKRAKEDATAATDLRPEWAKGWSRLGAAEIGLGNFDAAVKAYKRGYSLDPSDQMKKNVEFAESKKNEPRQRPSAFRPTSGGSFGAATPGLSGAALILGFVQLIAHIFIVVNAFLSLLPGDGSSAWHAYKQAMLVSLISLIIGLVRAHGIPNLGTFKKVWRTLRHQQGGDQTMFNFLTDQQLHYILYTSLFITSAPSFIFLVPVLTLTVYSICNFLTQFFNKNMPAIGSKLTPVFRQVTSRGADISRLNANTELIIFFFLIFQLFSPSRNLLLIILYAHAFLRIRYMSSEDSKAAWGKVKASSDRVFNHPSCPPQVTGLYTKLVGFVHGLGNPQPPARS
eukprot:CAMPEP_0114553820 /NCGR_PEP_ID=MMETSP0114-20121206/7872_1 /TAXON_ID=31324 /ORGANISM="Goniomonas sp, Strain m" /LENGTH=394 /DNA_ID=CAMNT_0001738809 /DNA_START=35 /DNA_END=1219 /DNA_ORIENTATION=+